MNNVRLYEFNLPALITCPFADECKVFCYADKGSYKWKPVVNKYAFNLALTKNPDEFNIRQAKKLCEYLKIELKELVTLKMN